MIYVRRDPVMTAMQVGTVCAFAASIGDGFSFGSSAGCNAGCTTWARLPVADEGDGRALCYCPRC